MTQPRYDLSFKGDLIDGFFVDFVKADLQNLIKADQNFIDRLFSGTEQPIKKGVDKATAIKFQQAFKKVGAKLIVRQQGAKTQTPPTAHKPSPTKPASTANPPQAVTEFTTTSNRVEGENSPSLSETHQPTLHAPASIPAWSVSEPGVQLVESQAQPVVEVNLSGLSLAAAGEDLILEKPLEPAPPILDIDNISLAEPGATLDTLKDDKPPVQVDISHLSVE